MIQKITYNGNLQALILRSDFQQEGIKFFTPDVFSQQLAYMKRPTGYVIQPHIHNPVIREVMFTKEVLFIKSGVVRVDFYTEEQKYYQSSILNAGDVILLAYGGHGFEILQEAEIIEVKQGPFAGDSDKTRFNPTSDQKIELGDYE